MAKLCDECGNKHYAKGKCKIHYRMPSQMNPKPFKVKEQKQIPKVGDKRKKLDIAYYTLRKQFLKNNNHCQAGLTDCLNEATDIHHLYSGKNRSKYYLDSTTWIVVCRSCHNKIHSNISSEELIKLGLKKTEA